MSVCQSVCMGMSYCKYTLWQVCVISEFKFQPPVPLHQLQWLWLQVEEG